jgi:hypothetical protein
MELGDNLEKHRVSAEVDVVLSTVVSKCFKKACSKLTGRLYRDFLYQSIAFRTMLVQSLTKEDKHRQKNAQIFLNR